MANLLWNSDIDVYNTEVIPLSVAEGIAKYLPVQDLLTFARVSKNTYKSVNNPKLWVSKLKSLQVWNSAISLKQEDLADPKALNYLDNPLHCLDKVVKSSKMAKLQVLKIHRSLWPYYKDLLSNKPFDRLLIFKDFETPEDQAKILYNMLIFNKIDYVDQSRVLVQEKVNSLFEIFENAVLREMEIHYDLEDYDKTRQFVLILIMLKNEQTLIDFFLQKSIFDKEESDIFNLENFNPDKYYTQEEDGSKYHLDEEAFHTLVKDIADVFNHQSKVIDLIFPQTVPIMYKVCEELISNQLTELMLVLIENSKSRGLYLNLVPFIYQQMTTSLIELLNESQNIGVSYKQLICELIDMSFESFVAEYIREEMQSFKLITNEKIKEWKDLISKREAETSQNIWKLVKSETKNDFLTSFKKVFTISNSSDKEKKATEDENYSEIQAKAKILSENIKSLSKSFSPELILETLNEAKITLHRLLSFKNFSIASLKNDIFTAMQEIFIDVIDDIGNEHLRPGFDKALQYLQTYNPNSPTYTESHNETFVEPLVLFCDLITMADLIIQMIDIFYKEEMINRQIIKNENSILNPSLQNKKKLEGLVDKYVADGLNIGLEVLVNEIDAIYKETLTNEDYNPPSEEPSLFGATDAAQRAVKILEYNMDLIVDSADKSVVEVFHQEIAERFFQIIVKYLKKSTVSVTGATKLISDLNLYYEFISSHIKTNKRMVLPLYEALKKLGNVYLISGDDSKAIGKLVSDLSKFNGIFGQEEIYEFVQRRADWPVIRKHVEKVMYGFGLGDCSIC
ncbi:F-box protein: endocytic membrane traffic, recycling recycling 1 [Scheffersomyces coipomensis]|uniref:F-box protein: endocytic membrane traffic, recycling recycling 1 n=1 Tax=Scheffersomyces coipomensis TaxID=1788519 RepID=UPI00315DBE3F